MRKEKIVEIEGREIVVKELKTEDIARMYESEEGMAFLVGIIGGDVKAMRKALALATELPLDEIEKLTEGVSSYSKLVKAFLEVNRDFLEILPVMLENIASISKKIGILPQLSAS